MPAKPTRQHSLPTTRRPPEPRALRRHGPTASGENRPEPLQEPHSQPLVHHIVALAAAGWHVVELRPSLSSGQAALWHVAIARFDLAVKLSATEADPDAALAELARYASTDAAQER